MKKWFFLTFGLLCMSMSHAQLTATVQLEEPIEGLCDWKEVFVLFSGFRDQKEAVCPVSKAEIRERLETQLTYIKENSKFKGKFTINLYLNCKGEVVQCQLSKPSKSEEFNTQVEAIFNNLGEWKPGTFEDEAVDSTISYSFEVKKGGQLVY